MKLYKKYLVLSTDRFQADNFSSITDEVDRINEQSKHLSPAFKTEIIISFAKDHSLQNDWIDANPGLIELVTSGSLFTGSIEALFDSCTRNQPFREELENYLRISFA